MGVSIVELGSRTYIRIVHLGQDRKLGSWRGARVTADNAPFLQSIIWQQILAGTFRWEDWFSKDRHQYLVRELVPKWETCKPRRPATIAGMKGVTRRFLLPQLGDQDVRSLHSLDFDWIREKLGDSPQAKSVSRICQAFMNWTYRREIIPRQIFLPAIILPRKKTLFLKRADQELILEGIPEPWYGPCLMSVEMGMRTGEILALKWSDIDPDCGGLTVNRTYSGHTIVELPKEGAEKWLPIPAGLQTYLTRKRVKSKLGWVFVTKGGSRIRAGQMTQAFKHSARDAGFPAAHCHLNRHSLAIRLLGEGFALEQIQRLLGHRSRNTTERYARFEQVEVRKILRIREGGG